MGHALQRGAWALLLLRYSEFPEDAPCQLSVPGDLQLSPSTAWCRPGPCWPLWRRHLRRPFLHSSGGSQDHGLHTCLLLFFPNKSLSWNRNHAA